MRLAGQICRILGLLLIGATLAFWITLGASTGWTKTYIEVEKVDPVTEISYPERVDKFVPGVDFLGCGLIMGAALTLISIPLLKSKKQTA